MTKFRLDIAYDGSRFMGWQKQKHTKETVQSYLDKALEKIFNEKIITIASGRTDQGVHARHQVVHFSIKGELGKRKLVYALNRILPSEIVVKKAYLAPDNFHACHDAISKEYRYYLYDKKLKNPFWEPHALRLHPMPSLDLLNNYAEMLLGEHDFKAFQNTGTPVSTTIRRLSLSKWHKKGDFYEYRSRGNGYLKQMVRNMVGAMLDYAKKEKNTEDFKSLMEAGQRQKHYVAAPPKGLYLHWVYYSPELDNKCRKL